jgi:hypothetical protein
VRERCEFDVSFSESYLDVRPFVSHGWTLSCYVINLAAMLSLLFLIFEGQVGASSDGVYGSEGWETG